MAAILLATVLSGCAVLRQDAPKPVSYALPADPGAPLAGLAAAGLAATGADDAQASAFRLLDSGRAAFSARLALVERARRSIDVQVYIFNGDDSGKLMAAALLRAADRGVRVRLLVDDMYTGGHEGGISGLDSHPNVQIRLYNPFSLRGDVPLGRLAEFVGDADRLNRRMHNKLLVADNLLGITGGRNIGDEYFELERQRDFVDLDVLVAGPVVAELSAAFDTYWNAEPSVPAAALPRADSRGELLARARAGLEGHATAMAPRLQEYLGLDVLGEAGGDGFGPWAGGRAELLLDSPDKTTAGGRARDLPAVRLMNLGLAVEKEALIASPYFVPGQLGMDILKLMRNRGVQVAVLTNSLAANDVVMVHAGYARYRLPMLLAGIRLHELKPFRRRSALRQVLGSGSSRASLHGKVLVLDRKTIYVGSMNLDPRSVLLNTEAGLLIHSEAMAAQAAAVIERAMQPTHSWRVRLNPAADGPHNALLWQETTATGEVAHEREPRTGFWLRFLVDILSRLPMEGNL